MENEKDIVNKQTHLQKVKIIVIREYEIESFENHGKQLAEAIKNDGFENDDFKFVILD